MAIVPIVGSLPEERLRNKKRNYKTNVERCRKWAAEIKALLLLQNPPVKLAYASHHRGKLNQNKTVQSDLANNQNLAPNLTQIFVLNTR